MNLGRVLGICAVMALLVWGCAEETTSTGSDCVPGESTACTCPDGEEGAQVCVADGSGFEACVCDPAPNLAEDVGSSSEPGDVDAVAPVAQACVPGTSSECACTDGATGAQVCNEGGTGMESCVCDAPSADTVEPADAETEGEDTEEVGGDVDAPDEDMWEADITAEADVEDEADTTEDADTEEAPVFTDECVSSSDCDDGKECTLDLCNVLAGCEYFNQAVPCDDGLMCTTNDFCDWYETGTFGSPPTWKCVGGEAPDCDDDDPCTADSCTEDAFCINVPIPECG